ncbi:glutamate--tRNA ligase [Candidatus Woesearchaeota archaeon]|nr:glutamate--tRNA ligase [Candidatus Woesearchaeota archaeon]
MMSNTDKEVKKRIQVLAAHNAQKFKGKANPGAVLGAALQEFPEMKDKVNELRKNVGAVVKVINSMNLKDIEQIVKNNPLDQTKKGRKELSLPGNPKNVVMRFEPSPSGPMHIGHAYPLSLNHHFCQKYDGKLILRISDTNPENTEIYAFDMLAQDAQWLTGNNIAQVVIQSDNMEIYYSYAEQAITKGFAYVCKCTPEQFKTYTQKKKPCPCRDLPPEEHIERWEAMKTTAPQGSMVVRVKTDLKHNNPAMRDWPALRINTTPHPRQGTKYRVWPLLNWAVSVDDHTEGMTHTIRAKDHMDNEKRQKYLFDHFGWKMAEHHYVGKINFTGLKLSTTQTKADIKAGKYNGWDDIQLPFLGSLRRRGYQPEALVKFALSVGMTQNDKSVAVHEFFKQVNAFNKEILEKCYRYFIIINPVLVDFKEAPKKKLELNLHPDHKKGGRKMKVEQEYFLSLEDTNSLTDGMAHRLMDNLNFVRDNGNYYYQKGAYDDFRKTKGKIIHWLPAVKDLVHVTILMPDGTRQHGLGEAGLSKLDVGDIIQAERIGFMRLDSIEATPNSHPHYDLHGGNGKHLTFWFAHK